MILESVQQEPVLSNKGVILLCRSEADMQGKTPIRKTGKKMDPQCGGRKRKSKGRTYNGMGNVVDRDALDARNGEYGSDLSPRVSR